MEAVGADRPKSNLQILRLFIDGEAKFTLKPPLPVGRCAVVSYRCQLGLCGQQKGLQPVKHRGVTDTTPRSNEMVMTTLACCWTRSVNSDDREGFFQAPWPIKVDAIMSTLF